MTGQPLAVACGIAIDIEACGKRMPRGERTIHLPAGVAMDTITIELESWILQAPFPSTGTVFGLRSFQP
jgi:hypothetical protein